MPKWLRRIRGAVGMGLAWGAVGGLLLSLVPSALAAVGLADINPEIGAWRLTTAIAGPLIFLSSASAAGTLLLARAGEKRGLSQPDEELAEGGHGRRA